MDKNVLKKFAIESRQELMEKVANKINRYFVDEEFNVNQNGEVYVLVNDKHTLRLTKNEYENRQLLVKRIKEITLEQVIEEAAYTWFNRIIAIRYMEIHDYLPLTKDNQSLGVRVLSSKDNTPDPEIMKISNLINPDLDIEFNKEFYGSIQDNNKRFEYILLLVCKKLGKVIPQVFDGITDYIDILIPDNMLNDSGYITKVLKDVDITNFDKVEIIGWLYQYWNTEVFDEIYDGDMSNRKVDASKLPAATQLFTPEWVVKYMVENSLGRYWIEHSDKELIKKNWKYYIDTDLEIQDKIKPIELKFLDPCSGSGHVLVYAFEVLYQIYLDYGYSKNEIVDYILKYNLFGLDIDNRANQLSILSIILKAREYDKNIMSRDIIKNLNILGIIDSNNLDMSSIEFIKKKTNEEKIISYIVNAFKDAKEYGSILKVEKYDYQELIDKIIKIDENDLDIIDRGYMKTIKDKFLPIVKVAIILSQKYNAVATNPPYLNGTKMSAKLSSYCEKNYKDSKADLSAVFTTKTLYEFLDTKAYMGFVTTISWMYLKTFEEMRIRLIKEKQISSIVDFGTELFDGKIGHLPIVSWVNKNDTPKSDSLAIRLNQFVYSRREEKKFEFYNTNNYYKINQKDFESIPGMPIAYWITESIKNVFMNNKLLKDYAEPKQGIATSDNKRFLRLWSEVDYSNIAFNISNAEESSKSNLKWYPYNKGGNYRKWYGNNEFVLNWKNNGTELKNYKKSVIRNENYQLKEGITWSLINASFGGRYFENGHLFDVGGSGTFPSHDIIYYITGLLNTKIINEFLKILNPTLNFQVGNIASLPIIIDENNKTKIEEIVKDNIRISKEDWDDYETSWDFSEHPLLKNRTIEISDKVYSNQTLEKIYNVWEEKCNERFCRLKKNEEELNKIFIEIYGLQDVLDEKIEDKDITIRKADKEREVKSLISYAVGCMFGRFSLDNEGIVYAGGQFNKEKYKIFDVDNDNIIPITAENYFGDDIVSRFKKFIEVVYGKETLYENLEFIAETLGKKNGENSEETIRRYFINDFYNEHVKMYQKRPIYWLFDSGKKNGFKCLIYMHRYNEGLVSKIRLDYLHRMQNTYEKELKEITDRLNNDVDLATKRELAKRQADISAKLQETNEYDEKIAHIADQKIKIDLDDGVVVNYAKFSVKNPKTGKDESILAKIK